MHRIENITFQAEKQSGIRMKVYVYLSTLVFRLQAFMYDDYNRC